MNRAIEPSEIIIEKTGAPREEISHVNPWIRFIARFFDYSLFFCALWGLRQLFHGQFPFGKYEYFIPFEFFVWIPFEAILLSTLGTTPGKFFLRTKLRQGRKGRLEFTTALRRSFSVWFRGLGMGIPILNLFCLFLAYHKLKLLQITSWDRDDLITVTHYPIGRWRIGVALLIAISGQLFYFANKNIL
ncbi:MAG: RDD family protein [Chlamydiota bacterium]